MAEEHQAELTLLHVLPVPAGFMKPGQEMELRSQIQGLIDELQSRVSSQATVQIEFGEPAKIVADVAGSSRADLLVIGRKAEPGILGRLATTAYSIIQQSPCPVVSV
jgi:nucleotide-binding universal stress UspA family protein